MAALTILPISAALARLDGEIPMASSKRACSSPNAATLRRKRLKAASPPG